MNDNKYMTTSQVATVLGLSVATIKRWVDEGILPAHKTAGRHRRLLLSDVQRLAKQNHFPQADLSKLGFLTAPKKPDNFQKTSQLFHDALLAGDLVQARSLAFGAWESGVRMEKLADDIISPALTQIGEDWQQGKIDVYQEHHATRTCEAVLIEMKTRLEQSASQNRLLALGGAPETDPSVVPSLLIQLVLHECGWRAINFGPHTPFDSLTKAIREFEPKLVWLSITHPLEHAEQFLAEYQKLYQEAEARKIAVAVGGRALTARLRAQMPYTMFGDGMSQFAAFARSLQSGFKRPRRGRPPRTTAPASDND